MAISWLAYTPPRDAGISFCHDDEGKDIGNLGPMSTKWRVVLQDTALCPRTQECFKSNVASDLLNGSKIPNIDDFIVKLFSNRCKDDIGFGQPGVPEGDVDIIDTVPDKLPWLLLPHNTQCESLKFYDLSRNKVHELNLPGVLLGGVSVEVSKGWLAIAKKGQYIRDTSGDLCVLSQKIEHVETHIFKLAEDDEVRIKFIPVSSAARLPFIEAEYWEHNIATIKHAMYEPYLVESINGELLIIVAHNVCYAYYDEEDDDLEEERLDDFEHFYDEEGDHFESFYSKVSGFDVMEMDPNAGMILRSVQSLSDQLIFLTSGGRSVSVQANNLPCGIQRNCIFFLENDNYFSEVFEVFDDYQKREELLLRGSPQLLNYPNEGSSFLVNLINYYKS
ncbi:hypothetical protein SADUNF_Sadunf07G0043400 [Salix dunnii]|uniref:KIB1-4 beta-propeller domain-containing protein n=1 Tax=Salix dunnii TaxID=1413687 RepID=A0A835K1A7_9ROSI|nr:hypothetical protein SADUNF_Sadunf07G0043400 [Salix dunnii]